MSNDRLCDDVTPATELEFSEIGNTTVGPHAAAMVAFLSPLFLGFVLFGGALEPCDTFNVCGVDVKLVDINIEVAAVVVPAAPKLGDMFPNVELLAWMFEGKDEKLLLLLLLLFTSNGCTLCDEVTDVASGRYTL